MECYVARIGHLRLMFTIAALLTTFAWSRADNPSPPPGDPCASCRNAIRAAYDQMNTDFVNNDLVSSAALMTDDYMQVDPHGHALDKTGATKKFAWERKQIRTIQTQCSICSMTMSADGVHVAMATHSTGTGFKRVLFVNVSGKFVNDLKVNDLWVSTSAGWRLKSRQMLQDDSHVSAT